MKSLSDLQADIAISLATTGAKIKGDYPDNAWGIMLAHFDSCVAVYRHAKVETKNQGLQRDHVTNQTENVNDGDWEAWNEDNPNIPNITHSPVIYVATLDACNYFADPPPPLRDCLSVLANGGELSDEDLPIFLLMYGEFRSHLAIFHSWDPDVDELERVRRAGKNNNYRLMRYAAQFLSDEFKADEGLTMEAARNVFVIHIVNVINESETLPEGLTKEDFEKFLGNPDRHGPRLKKQFGQNLTRPKLKDWL